MRHSFAIPRSLYLLRMSPCFITPEILQQYDDQLREILSSIVNVHFTSENRSWIQAGLGIHIATHVASASGSHSLVHKILPLHFSIISFAHWDDALCVWSQGYSYPPPIGDGAILQKSWDSPLWLRPKIILIISQEYGFTHVTSSPRFPPS